MKESMWGYLIVALGIVIVAVLLLVQRLTTTNEQDYYLSREIIKASMYDAVDYGTYMKSGKLVMSKEKFVAVFTRRFAESVAPDRTYTLEFYDIHEYPPKATIRISTSSGETTINDDTVDIKINTFITAILETGENGEDLRVQISTTYGDVNNDGYLNITDANIIQAYINNGNRLPNEYRSCCTNYIDRADVNGDGSINNVDVIIIKKVLNNESLCDLNGDEVTNQADRTILNNYLNHSGTLTDAQKLIADINNDGSINRTDLTILDRSLASN